MVSDLERGENTTRLRERDFAAVAPWLCAALVLGVEALHRSPAMMIVVALSSLALLVLVLAGSALWEPSERLTGDTQGSGPVHTSVERVPEDTKDARIFPGYGVPSTPACAAASSSSS
jgi:hypothetical protein